MKLFPPNAGGLRRNRRASNILADARFEEAKGIVNRHPDDYGPAGIRRKKP